MTEPDRQADRSSLTSRLQNLFRDISEYLKSAPDNEKRRLLAFLEDWRKQQERRGHRRKPCSIRVTCSTRNFLSRDTIKDISVGGLFLETSESLSVGDKITLMFLRPDSKEQIDVAGQVTWTPLRGVGVQFTSAPRKELEAILAAL